jgi:Domain of unknown function (DUF4157)
MTAVLQHAPREATSAPAAARCSGAPRGLLLRKCACGGAAGSGGECKQCRRKRTGGIQAKLRVNQPGDAFEQEADRMAEAAVSGGAPAVSGHRATAVQRRGAGAAPAEAPGFVRGGPRDPSQPRDQGTRLGHDFGNVRVHADARAGASALAPATGPRFPLQRQDHVASQGPLAPRSSWGACCRGQMAGRFGMRADDARLFREADGSGGTVTHAPPVVHQALRSPGRPLDEATRAFMEPAFGRDFGHVRVHTGDLAAESARAVSARAYTVGGDIVFAEGSYSPSAADGRRLLAHELAHVVQQGTAGPTPLAPRDAAAPRQATAAVSLRTAAGSSVSPLLQRACAVTVEELGECTDGGARSVFDLAKTSESLVLFEKECDLNPGYADAFGRIASALPKDVRVVIHGFSSDQETADFACQRAVVARAELLRHGVEASQIDGLSYHSGVAGAPESHRSVVVERVATLVKQKRAATCEETREQEGPPQAAVREGGGKEVRDLPGRAGPAYRRPGWQGVGQVGVVRVCETGTKPEQCGARLRQAPSTEAGVPYVHLDENAKVFIVAENRKECWLYVSVTSEKHRGSFGYVSTHLVWRNLPDPHAVLYYVGKPGLGLQSVVENHPQYGAYDIRTGDDARSLVMAVLLANEEDPRTKGHVYLNQAKLADAKDPGIGERFKDRLDEYRRVLRPILQSVELQLGTKIWLPGEQYVDALKGKGVVPTRAGWKNALIGVAKGIGGFLAGLAEGFFSSIIDVFVGLYDLVKSVISLAADLVSGEALRKAKAFYDAVDEMSADELLEMLKGALVALASAMGDMVNDFVNRWNAKNVYKQWHFRGYVVGYILAEVLMAIFTGGAATAAKVLGKLGKVGKALLKILEAVFGTVDKVMDKIPGRRRRAEADPDVHKGDSPDKARELPFALSLAKAIAEGHDSKDSPPLAVIASLLPLRARYRWIKGFAARPKSPGHYRIVMLASEYELDSDYTSPVDEEFAEAGKKGTPTDRPEGTHKQIEADTARVKFVHDRGLERGKIRAVQDGLSPDVPGTGRSWENPYEFDGPYGRGIDDIMFDKQGNPVIVEYKGGRSELNGDQMQQSWVCRKIRQLRAVNDPMADTLEAAMRKNKLTGRVYRTPVDEKGDVGETFLDGGPRPYSGRCPP